MGIQCEKCGNGTKTSKYKFCSRKCWIESLKGIKRKTTVGKSQVHKWLDLHFGKTEICENPFKDCRENTVWYEWALIKGKKYERKRENFIRLCRSCHRRYDLTEDKKHKAIKNLWWKQEIKVPVWLGKKLSEGHRKKMSEANKGKNNPNWKGGIYINNIKKYNRDYYLSTKC